MSTEYRTATPEDYRPGTILKHKVECWRARIESHYRDDQYMAWIEFDSDSMKTFEGALHSRHAHCFDLVKLGDENEPET